jgi:hypothetical protein
MAILIGWLILKGRIYKPIILRSNNTVILKLPAKNDSVLEYTEKIVSGDNIFSVLKRVVDRENIYLGYKENEDGFLLVYQIGEIGGLITDCSLIPLVNNKKIIESPNKYYLKFGDEIKWVFRCNDM